MDMIVNLKLMKIYFYCNGIKKGEESIPEWNKKKDERLFMVVSFRGNNQHISIIHSNRKLV